MVQGVGIIISCQPHRHLGGLDRLLKIAEHTQRQSPHPLRLNGGGVGHGRLVGIGQAKIGG